jgi:hypothetical protein
MNYLDWIIIAVYIAGLTTISYYLSKGQNTTKNYYLAGRTFKWRQIGLSTMATQLGVVSFISVPAFVRVRILVLVEFHRIYHHLYCGLQLIFSDKACITIRKCHPILGNSQSHKAVKGVQNNQGALIMLKFYQLHSDTFTQKVRRKLKDLVVAHEIINVDKNTSLPKDFTKKELPVLSDGHEVWSSEKEINNFLYKLHQDLKLSRSMKSDACYIDSDNPDKCL